MTRDEILACYSEEEREKIINTYLDTIEILLSNNYYNGVDFFKLVNLDEKELYQSLCNLYGKRANKEELLNYIFQEFKYDLLKRLIKEELDDNNQLKQPFLIDNLDSIRDLILEHLTNNNITSKIVPEEEIRSLKKISNNKIETYIVGFLSTIDNSLFLLDTYNRLLLDNKIVFLNEEKDLDEVAKQHNIDREELLFNTSYQANEIITIVNKNDISNVIDVVHELIHYINLHNKDKLPILLLEFLPITFEYLASDYLLDQGVDEEEIRQMMSTRYLNTLVSGIISIDFIDILSLYIDNKDINKELIYEHFKNEYDESLGVSYDEYVNNKIDSFIKDFLLEKASIYKDLSYVVGDLLAYDCLDYYKESFTNQKEINNLVSTITNYNEYDIFNLLYKEKVKVNDK